MCVHLSLRPGIKRKESQLATGGFPARLWAPWGQDQGQIHFHGPLAMAMELDRWTDRQTAGQMGLYRWRWLAAFGDLSITPSNPKIIIVTESCLNDMFS